MRLVALISVMIVVGIGLPLVQADEMDHLIRDAISGSRQVRLQALTALGESGDLRALDPLLTALQDKDTVIRDRAMAALQSLLRTLKGLYGTLVQWIEKLLITLGVMPSPQLPELERTRHLRQI